MCKRSLIKVTANQIKVNFSRKKKFELKKLDFFYIEPIRNCDQCSAKCFKERFKTIKLVWTNESFLI